MTTRTELKSIDKRHKENLKNFREIKSIFNVHNVADRDYQKKSDERLERVEKQFERMEPMIQAFENKKIVKMAFNTETKTLTFWVTTLTTWGVGLWAIVSAIRWLFIKT